MSSIVNYLSALLLLSQPIIYSTLLVSSPVIAQSSPSRFIENIEFLRITSVQGKANVSQGQVLRNPNDVVNVESGYIDIESNDGSLKLRVEASTIFYISDINTTNKTITLYVQRGFIRANLNRPQGNANKVIINTPGGYAAIRGTEISVTVSPFRVRFSMINDTAQIDDKDTLLQGKSLLRYADGTQIETELRENYLVALEQFNVDSVNKRFAIKGKTDNQNSILYKGEFVRVDSNGIFILNISTDDNLPITLLTPLGTVVHFRVSARGLI